MKRYAFWILLALGLGLMLGYLFWGMNQKEHVCWPPGRGEPDAMQHN